MAVSADPVDLLVKWLVEYLIRQGAQHGPRAIKSIWNHVRSLNRPRIFVPKSRLINRERELRAFNAALSEFPQSRIIYLFGVGGVGKTRLLEEIGRRVDELSSDHPLIWSRILDLYHADLHSITALQTAIVEAFDPSQNYFQGFRENLRKFQRLRLEGLLGPSLDKELEKLNTAFLEGYNLFAINYRLVLTFDTLESLNTEHEFIQSLCNLPAASETVRDWLVKWVNHVNNSVVILAGRPQSAFRCDLERACAHTPGLLEVIEVGELTRDDSRVLLESFLDKAHTPSVKALQTHADILWNVTRGLPVQLALIIELTAQGENLPLNGKAEGNEGIQRWGKRLVSDFFRYDGTGKHLLFILALTRKGLTVELLNHLEPLWPRVKCENKIADLRNLSVVKTRPGQEAIFLHDALYELFDAYVSVDMDLATWYARIADHYRDAQAKAGSNRDEWGLAVVPLLYYELQRDPLAAFESEYIRWNEEAIRGYEIELDMQLRDELLRFTQHPVHGPRAANQGLTNIVINRDGAIRWIKRYIIRARYKQAAAVAESILSLVPESPVSFKLDSVSGVIHVALDVLSEARTTFAPSDSFFWGHLLTCYGEALVFLGQPEKHSHQILDEASRLLYSAPRPHNDAQTWLRERVLGRVSDRLGYLSRTHGHFGKAKKHYLQALHHFTQPDLPDAIDDEQATTLNNLAFVMALLGYFGRARGYTEQALAIRRKLGQAYPTALSYNTRGRICALQGKYILGQKDCEQALGIFERLESARGIGLACNALGFLLRKHGEEWESGKLGVDEAIALFKLADGYLQRAADLFSRQVAEPVRLWEAYNEQGSLHHSWGHVLLQRSDATSAKQKFEQALQFQLLALQCARSHRLHFQLADTCDDLAWLFSEQGGVPRSARWLDRCLKTVPTEYLLQKGEGFSNTPEPGEAYWYILGKIYLRRGLWALKSRCDLTCVDTQQAVEFFAQSAIYFERYCASEDIVDHEANQELNRRLAYMSKCLEAAHITPTNVKEIVEKVMVDYNIDSSMFQKMFDSPKG
jgi:tetratricopeptide (TPR) repeat protein